MELIFFGMIEKPICSRAAINMHFCLKNESVTVLDVDK